VSNRPREKKKAPTKRVVFTLIFLNDRLLEFWGRLCLFASLSALSYFSTRTKKKAKLNHTPENVFFLRITMVPSWYPWPAVGNTLKSTGITIIKCLSRVGKIKEKK